MSGRSSNEPASLFARGAGFLRRAMRKVGMLLLSAVIAAFVSFYVGRVTAPKAGPSVESQLEQLRQRAATFAEELVVVPAHLHGGTSYVVVTTKPPEIPFRATPPLRNLSDEIRIFDVVNGRLTQRFAFRPLLVHGRGFPWQFRLDSITDLQNTGNENVIGGFSTLIDSGGARALVPVIVAWSGVDRKYVLEPLLPEAPHLPGVFHRLLGVGGPTWWLLQTKGVTLRDPTTGQSFHGYGGLDFAVKKVHSFQAPSTTGLVILGAVGVERGPEPVVRVTGVVLKPTLPHVTVQLCPALNSHLRLAIEVNIHSELIRAFGSSAAQC